VVHCLGAPVVDDSSLQPQFFDNPDIADGIDLLSSDGSWVTINSSEWLPRNYGSRPFVDVVVSAYIWHFVLQLLKLIR
jgi:hypothetical protein